MGEWEGGREGSAGEGTGDQVGGRERGDGGLSRSKGTGDRVGGRERGDGGGERRRERKE